MSFHPQNRPHPQSHLYCPTCIRGCDERGQRPVHGEERRSGQDNLHLGDLLGQVWGQVWGEATDVMRDLRIMTVTNFSSEVNKSWSADELHSRMRRLATHRHGNLDHPGVARNPERAHDLPEDRCQCLAQARVAKNRESPHHRSTGRR